MSVQEINPPMRKTLIGRLIAGLFSMGGKTRTLSLQQCPTVNRVIVGNGSTVTVSYTEPRDARHTLIDTWVRGFHEHLKRNTQ